MTPKELGTAQREFNGSCFVRGEWGHRAMECPRRARAQPTGRGRGGAWRGRGAAVVGRQANNVAIEEVPENEQA